MRIRTYTVWAAVTVLSGGSPALCQESDPSTATQETSAAENSETATAEPRQLPTPQHRRLDFFVGDWTTTARLWPDGGSEAVEVQGRSTFSWILDGRFVIEEAVSRLGDRPYGEIGLLGFDAKRGQYTAFWVNSMETTATTAEGWFDAEHNCFVFHGTRDVLSQEQLTRMTKYLICVRSASEFDVKLLDPSPEADRLLTEITYRRHSGAEESDSR